MITECGVSTSGGTKVPDVVWFSSQHPQVLQARILTAKPAPEICIEICLQTIQRKKYGKKRCCILKLAQREVWICDVEGKMRFLFNDW